MTKDEIKNCIPHRDPFLLLDEIVALDETKIHARTFVSPDWPVFQGHYPEFPVLPGVLQCEMAFQASAVLISKIMPVDEGKVPVVTRQNNTQFRQLVRPGDTLDIEVEITERLADAFFLKGKVSRDGKATTRLEFATSQAPKPD